MSKKHVWNSPKSHGVVSWRTQSSASKRTAKDAAPESELIALEEILANVNARAGKKRHRLSLNMSETLCTSESELNEESNPAFQSTQATQVGQSPAGDQSAVMAHEGKRLLQSWLAFSDKRPRKKALSFPLPSTLEEACKENIGPSNVPAGDPSVKNLSGDFEQLEQSDKVLQIIEELESKIPSEYTRQRAQQHRYVSSSFLSERPAAETLPREHVCSQQRQLQVEQSRQPRGVQKKKVSKSDIEKKKLAALQRRAQKQREAERQKQQQEQHQISQIQQRVAVRAVAQQMNRPPLQPVEPVSVESTVCQTSKRDAIDVSHSDEDEDMFDLLAAKLADEYEKKEQSKDESWATLGREDSFPAGRKILPPTSGSLADPSFRSFTRFKVLTVMVLENGNIKCELASRPGDEKAQVELRDVWSETVPKEGDYLHIVWTTNPPPSWKDGHTVVVDENHHFVVICPDLLVSPTRVSGTLTCLRRAVLSEHIQTFQANRHSVLGNAKHELVERAFLPLLSQQGEDSSPRFDRPYLESMIHSIVSMPAMQEQLFSVDLTEEEAVKELQCILPALEDFESRFIRALKDNTVDMREGRSGRLQIKHVVATEEKIFSPMWGLKGQPDLLVRASLQMLASSDVSDVLLPIELKTGAMQQLGHEAQVQLYALLLTDRYFGQNVLGGPSCPDSSGMLLHITRQKRGEKQGTEVATVRGVAHKHVLVAHLLAKRNAFAVSIAPSYLRGSSNTKTGGLDVENIEDLLPPPLPGVLGNPGKICENCFEKSACMIFHRSLENGSAETSGMPEQHLHALVGHLSDSDLDYFRSWNMMIDLESGASVGHQREIWTLSGLAREAKGRCISSLELLSATLDTSSPDARSFVFRFQRCRREDEDLLSIQELPFEVGDYVTFSIEGKHHAVGSGFLSHVGNETVSIRASQPLKLLSMEDTKSLVWRVDKDELYTGLRIVKNNLILILQPDNSRLRRLVIGLEAPHFVDDEAGIQAGQKLATPPTLGWLRRLQNLPAALWSGRYKLRDVRNFPKVMALMNLERRQLEKQQRVTARSKMQLQLMEMYTGLNEDQRRTVAMVLAAKDYVCVHGMPGTGKTTTIAFIILALRALGCSVLICAYTHTAVDNVLMKLQSFDVEFWRLGNCESVHPQVRPHVLQSQHRSMAEFKALQEDSRLIVGSTCLAAAKHPLIQKRRFDFCIIDEAGQLTQPICFGPLCFAESFVLVGDDRQLPPLVKSSQAKKLGMDVSLLQRLSSAHPQSTSPLTLQFRMNQDITDLANGLIYKDQLKCGNQVVATRALTFSTAPRIALAEYCESAASWVVDAISVERGVLFLDTDQIVEARERRLAVREHRNVGKKESSELCSQTQSQAVTSPRGRSHLHGKLENNVEALVTKGLVMSLVRCGIRPDQIGVISPYRSQLRLLELQLASFTPELEIQTVDRYQGRDKDCIIVSLVRSNLNRDVGCLLRDWRRINVAFTRAKCKLFVIGSRETLEESTVFSTFIRIVRERQWYMTLPVGGHEPFESSQLAGDKRRAPPRELVPPAEHAGLGISRNICQEVCSGFDQL